MKTGAYSPFDAGSFTPASAPCAQARSLTRQTARFSDAELPRVPKTPRAARPIFLFGFVGMALLLAGSVFLGIAALLRDMRQRQWHRNAPRRLR
jgi:hypothetical protein